MAIITLAMAQPIEVAIVKYNQSLMRELNEAQQVTYNKGEEFIGPDRSVEELFVLIDETEADLRRIRNLRDVQNQTTLVQWSIDDSFAPMTIAEALQLARAMRDRLRLYQQLASANPNPITSRWGNGETVSQVTYDPKLYKEKAFQLERQVNALSLAIDQANQLTQFEFDASKYLEGLK